MVAAGAEAGLGQKRMAATLGRSMRSAQRPVRLIKDFSALLLVLTYAVLHAG